MNELTIGPIPARIKCRKGALGGVTMAFLCGTRDCPEEIVFNVPLSDVSNNHRQWFIRESYGCSKTGVWLKTRRPATRELEQRDYVDFIYGDYARNGGRLVEEARQKLIEKGEDPNQVVSRTQEERDEILRLAKRDRTFSCVPISREKFPLTVKCGRCGRLSKISSSIDDSIL